MNEPEFLRLDKADKPTPPETDIFAEAIPPQSEVNVEAEPPKADIPIPVGPSVTFQGNNYDLAALISIITALPFVLSLVTCGVGFYFLPFISIPLAIVGLIKANDSFDPKRTKKFCWMSLGVNGIIILLGLLAMFLFIGLSRGTFD